MGKVELEVLLKLLTLLLGEDLVQGALEAVAFQHGEALERNERAVLAEHRNRARREVQVRGLVLDNHAQRLIEVDVRALEGLAHPDAGIAGGNLDGSLRGRTLLPLLVLLGGSPLLVLLAVRGGRTLLLRRLLRGLALLRRLRVLP